MPEDAVIDPPETPTEASLRQIWTALAAQASTLGEMLATLKKIEAAISSSRYARGDFSSP